MADTPYSADPGAYIAAAQAQQPTPMPGRVPVSSFNLSRPPPRSFIGPSHDALLQQLMGSLQTSNNLPSLLAALTGNPALAQQVGQFTPQQQPPGVTAPYRIDWGTSSK